MATEVEAEGYDATPWLRPPRLRTGSEDDRRATWLELFFDLIFVAAVAQVATGLVDDHSAEGFLRYGGLFVPVVWLWAGFTFYANRFDSDDLIYRLTVALGVLGTAALAVTMDDVTTGGSAAFALAYIATRLVIIALYVRAYRHVPEARAPVTTFLRFFGVGAALWVLSLAFATPGRYWVWVLATSIELATPIVAWRQFSSSPVNREHIEERFGLFTIIVLGESVIAVVAGIDLTGWQTESSVVAVAGFVLALSLWWIYFDLADTSIIRRGLYGLIYVYGHIPLYAGVAAAGVGVKLAIKEAPGGALSAGTRWALCGGIAAYLLALALFHVATRSRQRAGVARTRVLGAAALVAAAAFGASLDPVILPLGIALLLIAELVYEARVCRGNPLVCAPMELYEADRGELPVLALPAKSDG